MASLHAASTCITAAHASEYADHPLEPFACIVTGVSLDLRRSCSILCHFVQAHTRQLAADSARHVLTALAYLIGLLAATASHCLTDACGFRGHVHQARRTSLPCERWCDSCNVHHATEEGEIWAVAQSAFLLRRTRYYYHAVGQVFDVTPWVTCIGLSAHLTPGSHLAYSSVGGSYGRSQQQGPQRVNKKKQGKNKRR